MKLILFVLMIGVFVVMAARPQSRNGIRWGWTAEQYPVSKVGYYGFLAGFLLVFVSPFAADYFGSTDWILLVFAGFVLFMCAPADGGGYRVSNLSAARSGSRLH